MTNLLTKDNLLFLKRSPQNGGKLQNHFGQYTNSDKNYCYDKDGTREWKKGYYYYNYKGKLKWKDGDWIGVQKNNSDFKSE